MMQEDYLDRAKCFDDFKWTTSVMWYHLKIGFNKLEI